MAAGLLAFKGFQGTEWNPGRVREWVSFLVSSFAGWEEEHGLLWGTVESSVRYHTSGF